MSNQKIREQVSKIRRFINIPHKHYELRQNKAMFSQLCSSLDVIEDTEDAITAYTENDFGEIKPLNYLLMYGLLQSIYVQQDAVINLCESLGTSDKINNYPNLKEIRDVRNDTVGHPTKRDHKKGNRVSYHHVTQLTLNKSGFTLTSYYSDGSPEQFRKIDIPELIAEQNKYISEILSNLIRNLEAEEKAHKEKFSMEKLLKLFPGTLDYHLSKLLEAVYREEYAKIAESDLDVISTVAKHFRDAIARRNMDFYERLQDEYELIDHATTKIRMFLRENKGEKSAIRIYIIFLKYQFNELKIYAKEIDDEYVKEPDK